jgi:hypothetical protein
LVTRRFAALTVGTGCHVARNAGDPRSEENRLMATDYDAPRTITADAAEESLEELAARRDTGTGSAAIDADDPTETFELPGAEIVDDELTVAVIPMQADEFRCPNCFLIHLTRLAVLRGGVLVCQECG